MLICIINNCIPLTNASVQFNLIQDMLESYDRKAKPTWDNNRAVNVTFSMDLYQILELNEPQQYILLNAWIIERWHDEFLYWNPLDYGNITELRLPYDAIWMPDTTLYNSLVMKDDDTRRLLNAKLTTNVTRKAVLIELLYPTIYKFSCLLSLRYFPYDLQVCTMTFSSWTYDQKGIDYLPYSDTIGISNYLENEGWYLLKTSVKRQEVMYSCCPNMYTLLKLTLYLRRKPLFYLINLIIPTSIITLIAIVGFFTTSSASGMREEKVSLGITTLLSMSILMLMVSDQMPTTSTFIPLIGWFILGTIILISIGTLASTVVIAVQKRGRLGERLSQNAISLTNFFACVSFTDMPLHLRKEKDQIKESKKNEEELRVIMHSSMQHNGNIRQNGKTLYNYNTRIANLINCFRRNENNGIIGPDKSTDFLMVDTDKYNKDRLQFSLALPGEIDGEIIKRVPTPNRLENDNEITATSIAQPQSTVIRRGSRYRRTVPRNSATIMAPSGIGAVLATNAIASAVAAPTIPMQRLSLLDMADDESDNDSDEYSFVGAGFGIAAIGNQFANTVLASGNLSGKIPQRFDTFSPRKEQFLQQARLTNESIRQNRLLAQKEYEWMATVLERCCFIIFMIIYFLLTFGINIIGYMHWSDVESWIKRDADERHF